MTDARYTSEDRAEFAIQAMRSFCTRALNTAERITSSAQRGETKVVEQELKMLASLRAEAERFDYTKGESDAQVQHDVQNRGRGALEGVLVGRWGQVAEASHPARVEQASFDDQGDGGAIG